MTILNPSYQQPEPVSIDLYDSEIARALDLLEELNEKVKHAGSIDRGQLDREIIERFGDIGLVVETRWWHTDVAEVKVPDVYFVGRRGSQTEGSFDHDQMAHEVRADVLGLGTGGTIKMSPEDAKAALDREAAHRRAHHQGHRHERD